MFKVRFGRLNLVICKNYDELSLAAGEHMARLIRTNADIILGLATGSTPIGVYKDLVRRHKNGELSFGNVRTFNLDEYYPIAKTDPQSYHYFMDLHLFDHVNINRSNINFPDLSAETPEKAASDYELLLEMSPQIDLQLLGIGENGHIGFNEPSGTFSRVTHYIELSESTRKANSRFFSSIDDVPTHAVTMGVKSIMMAKQLVMVASGAQKAEILAKALYEEITPQVPASIIQMHNDCWVFCDEAAASKLGV